MVGRCHGNWYGKRLWSSDNTEMANARCDCTVIMLHSIAPSTTSYLLSMCWCQSPELISIKLLQTVEDNALDVPMQTQVVIWYIHQLSCHSNLQVEAHSHSIGGHHDVDVRARVIEELGLLYPSGCMREISPVAPQYHWVSPPPGGRLPYTTAHFCPVTASILLRVSKTCFLENTITQSPLLTER